MKSFILGNNLCWRAFLFRQLYHINERKSHSFSQRLRKMSFYREEKTSFTYVHHMDTISHIGRSNEISASFSVRNDFIIVNVFSLRTTAACGNNLSLVKRTQYSAVTSGNLSEKTVINDCKSTWKNQFFFQLNSVYSIRLSWSFLREFHQFEMILFLFYSMYLLINHGLQMICNHLWIHPNDMWDDSILSWTDGY